MKISTGNPDFNEWLDGGYESDIITTIYGPAGSGKTNLCLLAAIEQAAKGKKVVYIDTEGGFSVDRLRQLTNDSVLNNILLLKATNFKEQQEICNRLLEEIKNPVGLIIIDSIAMLYRLEMGIARENGSHEGIKKINQGMARQLRILNEISRKRGIPILITNQVYSDFLSNEKIAELKEKGIDINLEKEKNVHMVGGDLLKYWSKCIIELKRNGGKRKAILRKHRSMPEKYFDFYITKKGIAKSSWLFGK